MRTKSLIILTLAFLAASSVLCFFLSLQLFTSASERNEIRNYAEQAEMLQKIFHREAGYYRLLTSEHAAMIDTSELMAQMESEYDSHQIPSYLMMTKIDFMGLFSKDFTEYYAASTPDFSSLTEETIINIMKVRTELQRFVIEGGEFFTVGIPSKNSAMLLSIFPISSSIGDGFLITGYKLNQEFISSIYSSFGIEAGIAVTRTKTKPEYTENDFFSYYSIELLSKSTARINFTLKDPKGTDVLHIFFPINRHANIEAIYYLNMSSVYFIVFSAIWLVAVLLLFYFKIVLPLRALTTVASGAQSNNQVKPLNLPSEFTVIEKALKKVNEKTETLERNYTKHSSSDTLTGILNMRFFDEIFFFEWQSAIRNNTSIGLLIADIDSFKLYNREYGYSEGDKCIAKVAEVIKEAVKEKTDIIARRSGEEFMILLPTGDRDTCIKAAENILNAMKTRSIPNAVSDDKIVTLSIGMCALVPTKNDSKELLVLRSEHALYEAKKRKNAAEIFEAK
jgi:diguanylate cyclase (GGDEF)-like protein